MALVWRDQCKLFNKQQRKSSLKHPIQLGRNLTIYLTDEGREQLTVANWLRAHDIFFLHVPNESKRHRLEAITLKLLGLTPGASDILIFDTPPNHPNKKGFCLEMKSLTGKPTENQISWQATMAGKGWVNAICYGAEDALNILKLAGYAKDCKCPYCRM